MVRRFSSTTPIVGLIVSLLALLLPAPGGAGCDLSSPLFGLTVPEGYRQWQVVAPSHRIDKDELRVILGNDIAMKAYRAGTLPFPDGTILAKLAWKRGKSAEFETAFLSGEPQRIEFMVKNAKKHASTGGWEDRPVRERETGGRKSARHLLPLPPGERERARLPLHPVRPVSRTTSDAA
jgi:hypothetical protein